MPTTDDVIIAGIPSPTLLDLFGTVSEKEIGIMTIPSYNSWLGKLNDSPYKTSGPTGAWAGEWWSIYNYLQYGGICVVGSTGSLGNNNLVDLDIIFNDGLSDTMFFDSIELTETRKDCLGFLGTQKNLKSFTTNVYNKSIKFKDFTDPTNVDDIILNIPIDDTTLRSSIQSIIKLPGDKKDTYLPETEISYLVPFLDYSGSSLWTDGSRQNKTHIYYNSNTTGFILSPPVVKNGFSKNVLSEVTGISAENISIGPNHIAVVTSTGGYTAFESSFNTETKFRTTPPSGLTGIKSVAVGYHHTCVVTAGGNVVCWGQEDRNKAYSQTGYNIEGVCSSNPIALIYGTKLQNNGSGFTYAYGRELNTVGNTDNTTTDIPPPLVPVQINGMTLTDIIKVFCPVSHNFETTFSSTGNGKFLNINKPRSGFSNVAISAGGTYYAWGIGGGWSSSTQNSSTIPIRHSVNGNFDPFKISNGAQNIQTTDLEKYVSNYKNTYPYFQKIPTQSITPLNNIPGLDNNDVDYISFSNTTSTRNTGITQDWEFLQDYYVVFKNKKVKITNNTNILNKIVIDKGIRFESQGNAYEIYYKGGISLYNNGLIDAWGSLAGLCSATTNYITNKLVQNKFLHVGGSTLDFSVYNKKMNNLGVTCTNVYTSDYTFIAISNNQIYYTNTMADIVINQQQKWYEPIQWPLGTTLTNVIDAKKTYDMNRLMCENSGNSYNNFTFMVAILKNKNVVVIPSGATYRSSIANADNLNSYMSQNNNGITGAVFHNQYLGTDSNGNGITLSGGTTYGSVIKILGQTLSDVTQTCCGVVTDLNDPITIQYQILALKTNGSVVHWGNSNNKNIPEIANNGVVYLESAVRNTSEIDISNLCGHPDNGAGIDTRYVALKTDGSVVSWLMSNGNDNYLHYPGPYTSVSTNFNGPFAVNMKGDIEVLYSTDDYLKLENENYLSFDKIYAHSHYIIATTKNDKFRILDYYKNFLNNQDYRFVNKPDYSTTEGSNYYTNDNNLCFFSDKKQIISPWTNTIVNISTNTDAAGSIARLSTSKDRWKPFSGISRGSLLNTLPNPINEFSSNDDENYLNAVYNKTKNHNDIVFLNGNKIATHLFSFDNSDKINETYVLVLLKRKIKSVFKKYAFELNNESIRSNLKSDVDSELDKILNYNAISSYTLVCDETNNTPSKIKTGSLFVDITLKFPGIIDNIVLNCVIDGNKITI